MTRTRAPYVVALAAAVLALVASVGIAAAVGVSDHHPEPTGWAVHPRGDDDAMMGGRSMMADRWDDDSGSTDATTPDQARADAQAWVDDHLAGAQLEDGVPMPMGYRFLVVRDGTLVGVVMVDEDTGSVWGHLSDAAEHR